MRSRRKMAISCKTISSMPWKRAQLESGEGEEEEDRDRGEKLSGEFEVESVGTKEDQDQHADDHRLHQQRYDVRRALREDLKGAAGGGRRTAAVAAEAAGIARRTERLVLRVGLCSGDRLWLAMQHVAKSEEARERAARWGSLRLPGAG